MKGSGLKEKLLKNKAIRWHYQFLTTVNDSKATLYANIAVAMFFGHVLQPIFLPILFLLTYMFSFFIWTRKNKTIEMKKINTEKLGAE